MSDKDLLECCQSILDFLCEDEDATWRTKNVRVPTPKQKIMDEVLTRNGWGRFTQFSGNGDMFGFTEYLNNIFQMGYQIKDESGNYKPFFSSEQSRNFYRHFVRKLKLKQLV
jgi:hypothetical protein